jgi:hypothetical protein
LIDFDRASFQTGTAPARAGVDTGMKHAATRMIYAYWDLLRGARAAPERGEIEPGEIRHFLGDTFILELAPGAPSTIRLAGTRICALFGRELKGHAFEDLWAANESGDPNALLEPVVSETAPVVAGLVGRTEHGDRVNLEMILLPLRHGGKPHARVLGAVAPLMVPTWIGLHPVESLATLSMRVMPPTRAAKAPPDPSEPATRSPPQLKVYQGGRI